MSRLPGRGALTDWLIGVLKDLLEDEILVGDGVAPAEGGWDESGQPGSSSFIGYVAVLETGATPNHASPIGDPDSSWAVGYSLRVVGGTRQQAGHVADRVRSAFDDLPGMKVLIPDTWSIEKINYSTLGGVGRNDSTSPQSWEATDSIALWLSR